MKDKRTPVLNIALSALCGILITPLLLAGCSSTDPAYVTITGDLATIPISISDVTDLQTELDGKVEFTLTGDIVTAGYDFDAGSSSIDLKTTSAYVFNLTSTQDAEGGAFISFIHDSASPADNDYQGLRFRSNNDADELTTFGSILCVVADASDGTEDGKYSWQLREAGGWNVVMEIDSTGALKVDDSYDTFDEYDDAELLREGISKGNRDLLVDAGVLVEKENSPGEYLISFQNIIKLVSGGVYQNRDKIDELAARIDELEKLLAVK